MTTDEEKRRLKKLGKQEIEARSAELRRAMQESNPAPVGSDEWAANYRRGTEREQRLRRRRPTLHADEWRDGFTLLPVRNDNLAVSTDLFVQCLSCDSVLPSYPRRIYWSRCACGNLRVWRLLWWYRFRATDAAKSQPVHLIGKP